MAAFAISSPLPAAPRAGFGRWAQTLTEWNERRVTRRALSRLDAHLLRDIGVTPPRADPGVELLRKARVSW